MKKKNVHTKITPTKKKYTHVGGGCMMGEPAGSYCCDDQWMNEETREVISIGCTMEAHINILKTLKEITGIGDVLLLKGVSKDYDIYRRGGIKWQEKK